METLPSTSSGALGLSPSDTDLLRETVRWYDFEQRRHLTQFGPLTPSRLLVILLRRGPQSQSDIVRVMSLEKSWISRAVDGLEAKGWVVRERNPDDGRSVVLNLTSAGREEAQRIEAELRLHAQAVLERVDPAKRAVVLEALHALHDVLEPPFRSRCAKR